MQRENFMAGSQHGWIFLLSTIWGSSTRREAPIKLQFFSRIFREKEGVKEMDTEHLL